MEKIIPRTSFITFGDGNARLRGAARRLARQVRKSSLFSEVKIYNLSNMKKEFPSFFEKHGNFLFSNKRGFGYWIWKPYIIYQSLCLLDENDLLIYADAGCEYDPSGDRHLRELAGLVEFDVFAVVLEDEHSTRRWTNRECLFMLDKTNRFIDMPQISATFVVLRNSQKTRSLARVWYEHCIADEYHLVKDLYPSNEDLMFEEHRHDQAIFSLLVRDYMLNKALIIRLLEVENVSLHSGFPIRGVRNKTPIPQSIHNRYIRKIILVIYDFYAKIFNK